MSHKKLVEEIKRIITLIDESEKEHRARGPNVYGIKIMLEKALAEYGD